MATKKTSRKARRKKGSDLVGDSPITVGGGGGVGPWVELEFKHDDYVPDPDDPLNFINRDLTIKKIVVNGEETDLQPKSEIIIVFKKGTQTRKITIEADPPSEPLGIRFKGNHLRYNNQSKKHRDDGSVIRKVRINGETTNLPEDSLISVHTE